MTTLQIGSHWFPEHAGGLERMYYNLVHHLPGTGVRVHGLVAGSALVGESSCGQVRAFAAPTDSLPYRLYAARRAVRAVLQQHDIDLVATHFALYAFPGLDLIGPRALVVHFHGPWASEGRTEGDRFLLSRLKVQLEQRVYRRAQRYIVLSEAFRDVLHQTYEVPLSRINVVPGGVDAARFDTRLSRREARVKLGWPVGRPIVLAVRRLARRMGLEHLVDAMKQVARVVPEVLLVIAGKGPLAAELRARAEAHELQEHMIFAGFVPDEQLPLAYRAADLSIVPTEALEGFGLITLESLAAGTPVLVTPVGGLPETVRGLSPDLVLDGYQCDELADGMLAGLIGRRKLPGDAACQEYARTHFDWSVIASRIGAVYEEALR